jgi:hypothetical protein
MRLAYALQIAIRWLHNVQPVRFAVKMDAVAMFVNKLRLEYECLVLTQNKKEQTDHVKYSVKMSCSQYPFDSLSFSLI